MRAIQTTRLKSVSAHFTRSKYAESFTSERLSEIAAILRSNTKHNWEPFIKCISKPPIGSPVYEIGVECIDHATLPHTYNLITFDEKYVIAGQTHVRAHEYVHDYQTQQPHFHVYTDHSSSIRIEGYADMFSKACESTHHAHI